MAHTPLPACCAHLARGESPPLGPSHCVLDGKQAFPPQTDSSVAEDQPQPDQVIRHDPPLPQPVMSPWRQLQQRCTESTVCKDESSAECSEGSDTLMCSVSAPVWLQRSLQGFNRWRRPGSDFSGEARGEESSRAHTHARARTRTQTALLMRVHTHNKPAAKHLPHRPKVTHRLPLSAPTGGAVQQLKP